jgi:hypothetical protein
MQAAVDASGQTAKPKECWLMPRFIHQPRCFGTSHPSFAHLPFIYREVTNMASSLVASIDNGLGHIASLVDRPNLDYENIVIYSSWLLAAFEIWI